MMNDPFIFFYSFLGLENLKMERREEEMSFVKP